MAAPIPQGLQEASGTPSTATLTIGAGLGLAVDDIILAAAWNDSADVGTVPAFGGTYTGTWTEIIADADNSAPQLSLRYSRAVGAHTGETITLAQIGGGHPVIQAISIRGARTPGSPIGGAAAAFFSNEPPDWTPGISSKADDALVVWGIGDLQATADQLSSWTMAGSAMTEREDATPGTFMGVRAATLVQTTAGPVGTFDATFAYATTVDRRFWAVTVEPILSILNQTTNPLRSRRPLPMMRGPGLDARAMRRLR